MGTSEKWCGTWGRVYHSAISAFFRVPGSGFFGENDRRIHGWADPEGQAEPTQDYYRKVVDATFRGNLQAAREKARLFMAPGMGHCSGGPGAGDADPLKPLVDWVENGTAPNYIVAAHRTNGIVDNQRRVCAYPQRAVYVGSAGGQNDPSNWIERNFACR